MMRRSTATGPPSCGPCRGPWGAASEGSASGWPAGRSERIFSTASWRLALAVDQELARDDDLFSFGEAVSHFDPTVSGVEAQDDLTRLEASFAQRDDGDVATPGAQDRLVGNGHDAGARICGQGDVGEHVGLEELLGVLELDPHPRRARLRIEERVDVGDEAFEPRPGR